MSKNKYNLFSYSLFSSIYLSKIMLNWLAWNSEIPEPSTKISIDITPGILMIRIYTAASIKTLPASIIIVLIRCFTDIKSASLNVCFIGLINLACIGNMYVNINSQSKIKKQVIVNIIIFITVFSIGE